MLIVFDKKYLSPSYFDSKHIKLDVSMVSKYGNFLHVPSHSEMNLVYVYNLFDAVLSKNKVSWDFWHPQVHFSTRVLSLWTPRKISALPQEMEIHLVHLFHFSQHGDLPQHLCYFFKLYVDDDWAIENNWRCFSWLRIVRMVAKMGGNTTSTVIPNFNLRLKDSGSWGRWR